MESTLDQAWKELRQGLQAFIAKRVGSSVEVDDILQDVFVRMHQHLGTVRDQTRLPAYLYQITRHVIVDHYRSTERRREIPSGSAAELETIGMLPTTAFDQEEADKESAAQLAACLRPMLEQLGEGYREALRLVDLEGLTQQEAAKRVGLSVSGMKSRVQRGRQQLKAMLDECCLIQLDARNGVTRHVVRDRKRSPC